MSFRFMVVLLAMVQVCSFVTLQQRYTRGGGVRRKLYASSTDLPISTTPPPPLSSTPLVDMQSTHLKQPTQYKYSTMSAQVVVITEVLSTIFDFASGASASEVFFRVLSTAVDWSGLYVTLIVASVLQGASSRGRLEGNTFKLLNLGLFLSSILFYTVSIAKQKVLLGGSFFSINTLRLTSQLAFAVFSALPCYLSLKEYGLPKPKMQFLPFASLPFLCLFSAASVGLFSLFTALSQSISIAISSKTLVSCFAALAPSATGVSCFLVPLILFALHGAALAGPKRLSSDTYKALSASIILSSIAQVGSCLVLEISNVQKYITLLMSLVSLLTATFTLKIGLDYKGEEK